MNKPTLTLAAALLLSGATFASAQRDGGGNFAPPSQGMERAPSVELPRGADMPRGANPGASERLERRSEGPNPAVRDAPPAAEPREAGRKDAPGPADTKGTEKSEKKMRQDRGARESAREERMKPKGDISEPKSTRQETKQDKSGARDKAAERAKETPRSRDNAARDEAGPSKSKDAAETKDPAKDTGETTRGDRDAPASKSAERERASPAAEAKNADGDRKPLDEVKKADLSGDRKERVSTAFRGDRDVKRRTNVDVNIIVGAHLPSAWDYAPVPIGVVEVVPEYRGYSYTYVEDTYVITDPESYEVVAVLPATEGDATYAAGGGGDGTCSTNLALTDEERELVLKSIQITDEVAVSNITVGWSVPRDIELRRFPDPVVDRASALVPCRYFIADDQIAIVDPQEDTVVFLIDHE